MPLYLSYDDTCRMIQGAVVQYNGRLVLVRSVNMDLEVYATDAETGEGFTFKADFEKIDNPKDGRLGYINRPTGDAMYIIRGAVRMYKMGLTVENLYHIRNGTANALAMRLGSILEGIHDCYTGKFPSFSEAYHLAKEGERIVAYDRSFAVSGRGVVFYQGLKVGHTTSEDEDGIKWTKKGLLASFIRHRPQLNWR